ncbi:MAG TPA: TatD family hydrolase, partial [Firmicutes bacterium]|nr:TatD family hydrolase [Bacillota bacterium]
AQMQLAAERKLPVVIHSRDAAADTMEILRQYPANGVIHCFGYSAEVAQEFVQMGYYIGFTGVLTFTNARKPLAALAKVPLNRLLLETDCPYMAPVPNRGKRCDSSMLPLTVAKMAEIQGVSEQEIVDHTRKNACRLFGIML